MEKYSANKDSKKAPGFFIYFILRMKEKKIRKKTKKSQRLQKKNVIFFEKGKHVKIPR